MNAAEFRQEARSKRIYILPNLLTTASMFFGFYAIMAGLAGQFEKAALCILIAGIFDGLDGRVARALGAVSAFGKEYDSLADFLSFGLAPALVVHQWALSSFNRVGWAAAFLYSVCGALRLARFNVSHYVDDRVSKRYFQGMPIPAAAGILSASMLFYSDLGITAATGEAAGLWRYMPLVLTFALGLLMVSSLRFRSFKDFTWHRQRPFLTLVGVVLVMVVMTINLSATLFLICMGYLLSVFHSHREYLQLLAEGKEVEEDEVEDLTRTE